MLGDTTAGQTGQNNGHDAGGDNDGPPPPRALARGTLALLGGLAGFLVGFGDGLWAGLAGGADGRGALAAALLAGSVDGLLGMVGCALLEVVARVSVWGRRVRVRRRANVWAAAVLGLLVAAGSIAVTAALVDRRNRFVAGGVVALATVAFGLGAAALQPALARVIARRRKAKAALASPDPALLLLAPLAMVVVDVVVMLAAIEVRRPLGAPKALRHLALLGIEAALLPALLVLAERLRVGMKLSRVIPVAVVLLGAPLVMFVARNWEAHLRFVPWTHVLPGVVIVAVAAANVPLLSRWSNVPAGGRVALTLGAAALFVVVLLSSSESEPARKFTAARAAFVGPTLAVARSVLDRDGDGYSKILGGGDCDDGDATVHPGILDFPDDGIDQDCDGRDATVAVLAPPPFGPVPPEVPGNLNLLLITVDTVRADHLGCYGYPRPTSPAIDRLAAEGALFLEGWAHAPSTRYSMPAIATGRWPSAITWDESIWWPRIAPSVRTMAEALKGAGYFTAAFYSYDYFSLADHRGFERGVDMYRADRASLHRAVNGPMESHGSSSRQMADDAITFIEAYRERKFFLWAHFYDPHLSYEPHAEVPSFGHSRVDLYDGEIRFTDLHVGRLLDRLRELGLWDKTAVVVTGDHGEGFGEHGVTEHGFDLYPPQTKVPLIIRVPGLPPRKVEVPAGHVDLAPTLLNLARAPQEPSFLGRSLLPEIAGTAVPAAPATPVAVFQEVTSERGKKRALATRDFHLIWNWTPENTTECYDRRADPLERRDLWGRQDDAACRRLKSDLQNMVSALSVPPGVAAKLRQGVFPAAAPAPHLGVTVDASIGDMVHVVGYSVHPHLRPSPNSMTTSGEFEVEILFECKRTVTGGWRLFFHLMGPGGSFRNLDHVPVEGAMPPDRWRPGQRILDRVRIPFGPGAPKGDYQLILGLFRGSDRLPVTPVEKSDGKRALRLTTLRL